VEHALTGGRTSDDLMLEIDEHNELDHGECLRLLAVGRVGRVVFTEAAMPAARPVSYLLDGEEVVFGTANGSRVATAVRHAVVAFQVDEIDLETCVGWSVLGVGEAYEVTEPARLAALTAHRPRSPTRTGHTIAIPLQWLTGCRLRLAADIG
jgi:nitroimidazol reductase NimA-like FMN-containing flavoprotein (pyridoxamine 5'-phosphate oxidase superfamily)